MKHKSSAIPPTAQDRGFPCEGLNEASEIEGIDRAKAELEKLLQETDTTAAQEILRNGLVQLEEQHVLMVEKQRQARQQEAKVKLEQLKTEVVQSMATVREEFGAVLDEGEIQELISAWLSDLEAELK